MKDSSVLCVVNDVLLFWHAKFLELLYEYTAETAHHVYVCKHYMHSDALTEY